MRFYKNILAAISALALVAAPAVAQAAESKAKPRSLSVMSNVKRLGALTKEESKQGGGTDRAALYANWKAWLAIGLVGGMALAAALIFAKEKAGTPIPVSP